MVKFTSRPKTEFPHDFEKGKGELPMNKVCTFFASDYHFEMISLPYITKKIEEQDEIIILTENNLEESMKTLLERTNFKKDKKENVLKINWKNADIEKLEKIDQKIKEGRQITIFIKGEKKYINQIHQNIDKHMIKKENIKVIDCYEIEEVGENLNEIMQHYQTVLGTTGEKEIQKL